MTSRLQHAGILILDATSKSRSSAMAAISWRSSRVLVPSWIHVAPPRSFHLCPAGVRAHSPPTTASFRLFGAARSSSSLHGFARCRAAADRDCNAVEQERGFERHGESLLREGNDFVRENVGGIHVITGPMFAGKTTALLKRIQHESDAGRSGHGEVLKSFGGHCQKEPDAGRKVSLVKSNKDTRYAVSAVVSHDGVQMPCLAVPSLAAFKDYVGEEAYTQMDVIGIDEAQFFDDLVEFCQSAADLDNKTVIVAGLDGDFLRRRFGGALDLIPLADSVTKLHARCELCNQPAPFTFRKTVDVETEIIGGADVYMPVCRHHFVTGQCAVEAARSLLEVAPSPASFSRI